MSQIKIRFNTQYAESPAKAYKWRVLVDDKEILAKSVAIQVPCHSTEDLLSNGITKWHMSCEGNVRIQDDAVTIEPL